MAKSVRWLGSSRGDVRLFPAEVRSRIGYELHRLELGLQPTDWKPMKTIGSGVREIRIRTEVEHRVMYVTTGTIWVLHVFQKRSRKTSRSDLDIGRSRYRIMSSFRQATRGGE